MPSAVLRWGQSAYETDDDMRRERQFAESLGMTWSIAPQVDAVPAGRADILVVTSKVRVDERALRAISPQLVITTTSGYEHIDLDACRALGVAACRCPIARRDAVTAHTVSSIIRLQRRLYAQESPAHDGRWSRADLPNIAPMGLAGSTVGVVGYGVIGSQVAEILHLLGAKIIVIDPHVSPARFECRSLEEALPSLDVLTLHAACPPSAANLVDAQALRRLKPGAIVVNTARGKLLDVQTAAQMVQRGALAGLACDVFPVEPWPHLAEQAAENILLTPHSSGYTADLGSRVAAEVGMALRAFSDGEPPLYLLTSD